MENKSRLQTHPLSVLYTLTMLVDHYFKTLYCAVERIEFYSGWTNQRLKYIDVYLVTARQMNGNLYNQLYWFLDVPLPLLGSLGPSGLTAKKNWITKKEKNEAKIYRLPLKAQRIKWIEMNVMRSSNSIRVNKREKG